MSVPWISFSRRIALRCSSRIIRFGILLVVNLLWTWCRSYLSFLYLVSPNGKVNREETLTALRDFRKKKNTQKFEDCRCCYDINSSVQLPTHRLLELYPASPQAAIPEDASIGPVSCLPPAQKCLWHPLPPQMSMGRQMNQTHGFSKSILKVFNLVPILS